MSQLHKLVGAMFITLLLACNLQAEDTAKRLFISLTSGDFKASGMGAAIAGAMQDAGVQSTVFIGADSVKWVLKKGKQEAFGPTGKSVRDMLVSLSKKGGKVILCGMCAKYTQTAQKDLIEGVKIVDGNGVYGALFAPNTQTLSF